MTKRSFIFLYALALYGLISMAAMSVQFLAAGVIVNFLSNACRAFLHPPLPDCAGFAFLTVTNTIVQYYLASILSRDLRAGSMRFGVLMFSGMFSAMFFMTLSGGSSLGLYKYAGAPLIFSYLLGGVRGLLQHEADNPFHGLKIRIFRIR